MRLGGPVFTAYEDPDAWLAEVKAAGYRACYCPLNPSSSEAETAAFCRAADRTGIVIAEVGAWCNPLSPDQAERQKAMEHCIQCLGLAERVGARCCVNISGSRGDQWDGHHPANLTQETFEMIVSTTRSILDAVKPLRTFYTLETMPWAYPDSADSYLALIRAVDRKAFGAHLDPVNLVCSPQRYYSNAALIKECVQKLGPYLRSCHAKDILLHPRFMVHLDEVRPGQGGLDYAAYLRELNRLDPDLPLMLEHLPDQEQYTAAAAYIRSVAETEGIAL